MGKYKKSQILILTLIVALLCVTPFLSSTIKPTHLYFIINILIVAVSFEAGLLTAFPKPPDAPKTGLESATKIVVPLNQAGVVSTVRVVKQSNVEKISVDAVKVVREVKKCTSVPSIFFISGGEIEGEDVFREEEGGEVGTAGDALDRQELSTKADTFIRDFYKQLKMQREVSYS